MSKKSSGTYIIDENYTVISVNQTLRELYPSVKPGKKCYQCLMHLDEPCPPCPVANHIQGPQTYLDPIRGIYETVDAVEVELPDGKLGHALVMSTVGESETISARLPRTRNELNKLLEQEYFDSLTGSFSRKGFIRECERVFSRMKRTDYAIILLDIHNFKAINDTFGIEGGDQILRYVFSTVRNSFLKPVVSSRIESDSFLFLVQRKNINKEQLEPLLNMEWAKDNRMIHFHLRCGIYFVENKDASVSRMINWTILANRYADQEKYGTYAVFDARMREKYLDQAEVISHFSESLKKEEFKVFYQPIIETTSGNICAAEALVRWNHPLRGLLAPDRFIPALEKTGLITQLDHYVLQHVYMFQKSLRSENMPVIPVSVNLSRQDFYNDSFMSQILSLTQEGNIPADCINYEVTETSVAILKENCDYLLQQIRQIGSKILLDDFGSGYSSLGMIGDYSFDIVKIDKSFVDQIEDKPVVRAVIDATINMCHSIGLSTVAEGVENSRQLHFLREHGCDFIQGYYYSRPLSEESFHTYLSKATVAKFESNSVPELRGLCQPDLDDMRDLIDHSDQFVQVCYPENYDIIYANEMTRNISGHPDLPYEGTKCYQYMLGLDAPCGHCPMRRMGDETEKILEVDDGAHVFRLKARYAIWNNRRVFIEYGHDITDTKIVQQRYMDQIRSILENIPAGQGVFHMDLTADKWISSGGNAENARAMQNIKDVDTLIRRIASFVPDSDGQKHFFQVFSREAQLKSFEENRRQIVLETESYYDDHSIRWSRITAQLIDNPESGHIESILYGVDISSEKTHIEELEQERMEKEQLQRQVDKTWKMYTQADHDRRYDFLTGLKSRLDLYHFTTQHNTGLVNGVMMLDLDNFKNVNDTYGHHSGDECLREIGRVLLDFGVHHDITFYRYGGEEIVGLSQNPENDMDALSRQILECVNHHNIRLSDHDGKLISVTVSIGYTAQPDHVTDMIRKADAAMYYAKKHGKKQVACLDTQKVSDRNQASEHR